jgi:hypothetical protein
MIFTVLGIASVFMPWVTYPIVGESLYGYFGDGIITGFLFLVTFILLLIPIFKKRDYKLVNAINFLIYLLLSIIFISGYEDFHNEKSKYVYKYAFSATTFGGYYMGYGFYLMGASSISASFILFTGFLKSIIFKREAKWSLYSDRAIVFISCFLFFSILFMDNPILKKGLKRDLSIEQFTTLISDQLNQMGEYLIHGDYNGFAELNHPIIIESLGGKEKLIEILKFNAADQKENNTELKSISLKEVIDVKSNFNSIQAITVQETIESRNGVDHAQNIKMLSYYDKNDDRLYFLSIEGKSSDDVSKFFPYLNKELKF